MAVIRMISENPMITQKELVKATGKSISTVKRIMNSLQEKGLKIKEKLITLTISAVLVLKLINLLLFYMKMLLYI